MTTSNNSLVFAVMERLGTEANENDAQRVIESCLDVDIDPLALDETDWGNLIDRLFNE